MPVFNVKTRPQDYEDVVSQLRSGYFDFFTSDIHFGHRNIIEYSRRPFSSVDEMNEAIIAAWNDQVSPESKVYVIGDVALGKIAETLPLVARLNGTLFLRTGNHDRNDPMHDDPRNGKSNKNRPAQTWDAAYFDAGFTSIEHGHGRVNLDAQHQGVLVCHFPYKGDSGDADRYSHLRPTDNGEWLIHGHVHDKWRQNGRQVNVGLDAWGGRLVTSTEIVSLIESGPAHLDRLPWPT